MGSDPEKLFPYALMQEHFRKFAKFGLLLSTALLPVVTAENGGIDMDEIAQNVKDGNEMDANVFISDKSRSQFNTRLRGVVIDMVRLGYI